MWTVKKEGGLSVSSDRNAAVAVRKRMYLFGDDDGQDHTMDGLMDIHMLQSDTYQWSVLKGADDFPNSQFNQIPRRRRGHTAVLDNDLVYIWGGLNTDGAACNNLYCFNTSTHRWCRQITSGEIPPARHGHSASVVNGSMYTFGGYVEQRYVKDCFKLDLKSFKWSRIDTIGENPIRLGHSANAINDRIYVFGYRGDDDSTGISYLDTRTLKWIKPDGKGHRAVQRMAHSSFCYKGSLFIVGGIHDGTDNLLRYEPDSCRWSAVEPRGNGGPCRRFRQCCCLIGDRVFMLGGSRLEEIVNETGEEDYVRVNFNDLHILDFSPSLKTLAIMSLLAHEVDKDKLPRMIRDDVVAMTLPYSEQQPLNDIGE